MTRRSPAILALFCLVATLMIGCADSNGAQHDDADPDASAADAGADARTDVTSSDADIGASRLVASPPEVSFNRVEPPADNADWPGEHEFLEVIVVGYAPVEIEAVYLQEDDDALYSLSYPLTDDSDDAWRRETDTDQLPRTEYQPGESFWIRVTFRPENSLPARAELVVESDAQNAPVVVPIGH